MGTHAVLHEGRRVPMLVSMKAEVCPRWSPYRAEGQEGAHVGLHEGRMVHMLVYMKPEGCPCWFHEGRWVPMMVSMKAEGCPCWSPSRQMGAHAGLHEGRMVPMLVSMKTGRCPRVNAGRPRTDVTKRNYTTPAVDVNNEDDSSDIFPVYCAALVLVIVGLVGYVIYKKYQRMRSKRRQKAPCSHEDVEYSKASGGDSGVFVDNDSPKYYTYCLASGVRDLPVGKRKELEKTLATPHSDSWKLLAKEIGYSSKRLTQLESRGGAEGNSSFKYMLHDWERRDAATVTRLIQALRNIGRQDAARIIYVDSTEGRTQMLSKHNSASQNMV
ncbi:tumor necrosis factor receptor superfamily member 16-like [Mya arenaria]|uniref:tumor necrosis factor receptor superfamily member 16-like n=1 Tax=Mya arenaria TaxID=6604 RepID=UPI0022DF72DB|nr:tumor necrosis factor receptor superfamily member 16-like [Mya arenaria]